ncbi:hypothetical protein PsorP6_002730 [Peronosclerospora sorghi]|uniref:Uncharacterized protein n=1 Tax=Peronosclerospora sorghi TaxID=230839 RepID=A0ACC0WX43_9STRA|nr:hypothetical protein PsorP6_002730 [Peronosclerospora sorghi]
MEQRKKDNKGTIGALSPRGLLTRGWTGITSPLNALNDSTVAGTAPRSVAPTPKNRMTLPSPNEYPSLFDVRSPNSTRFAGGMAVSRHTQEVDTGIGHSARESSGAKTSFFWTASNGEGWRKDELGGDAQDDGNQSYLPVYHHNLYSVLTNPKTNNWRGALLDVLYPALDVDIVLAPIPGLADGSTRDFQSYFHDYGKNITKYERNHRKPVNEQLSSNNVPSISVADGMIACLHSIAPHRQGLENMFAVLIESIDVTKCLKLVPNIFFRPDFDLKDPKIFEEVMNMQKDTSLQEEVHLIVIYVYFNRRMANTIVLNAQLTSYMDHVELTLLRQVSSRSDRFFEESAHQEVRKQAIQVACDEVATLRRTMDRLRNLLTDKSLDIVSLNNRQKRIKELHDLVSMIKEVKIAESAVEALLQCQDYTNALDMIECSQAILKEHLKGIHGLSSLREKFHSYINFISAQTSRRLISILMYPEWTFQDGDNTFDKKRLENLGNEKGSMQQNAKRLVDVLFRLDALNDTVKTYLNQLNEEIRVVVKTVVTETIAASSSSSSVSDQAAIESKVSNQLRALTSDEFLQCVQMIFEHLLIVLKRAVVVQSVLVTSMENKIDELTAEERQLKTVPSCDCENAQDNLLKVWSPSENLKNKHKALDDWKKKSRCTKVIKEIDEVVRKSCEFSQRSVSNLFAVRKEVQTTYTMPQLRKLYDATMDFVVSIEKLTGKTDYTLRGALFSQLKLFLEKYHQGQVSKLVSTLDHELWKSTEITETRHKSLDDLSNGRGVALLLSDERDVAGETAPPRKCVSICGKSFRVVWSVLLMLEIVMNYMSCAANFPVLATDVLQRSIEIFRLFNSRTTQLVLGAGAMQMARLKSISARHLGNSFMLMRAF